MKELFSKINFPTAPSGNIYHWEKADTVFEIHDDGKYVIQIIASAKNAKQNRSTDDDDLRVAIDDYEFGKYEIHDEKISWRGFGTASSWDGTSLKGSTKIIYFFLELRKGKHKIIFYADETPTLQEVKIFQIKEGEQFQIKKLQPPQKNNVDKDGIPWMSFVFLRVKPKDFSIASACKSAKQKGGTDGDNLKIVVNGKILHNKKSPASKKYKNFYFSGDLNQGQSEFLKIASENFEFLEDSVELWYDETPNVFVSLELFDSVKHWLNSGLPEKAKLKFYEFVLSTLVRSFSLVGRKYSSDFLKHSLSDNPKRLIFDNDSLLVSKIKKDGIYEKILNIVRNQIENDITDGQIYLGDESKGFNIEFKNGDLRSSLHGTKKIEYNVKPTLFDVYDFDPKYYEISLTWMFIHMADILEATTILRNFEIEIDIQDVINTNET